MLMSPGEALSPERNFFQFFAPTLPGPEAIPGLRQYENVSPEDQNACSELGFSEWRGSGKTSLPSGD